MRIFHLDWINKERELREVNIELNLWIIGAFILGYIAGRWTV